MKSIFSLTLGTIVMFLALTAHNSLGEKIFLAFVSLALFAITLSPGTARIKQKAIWHFKLNEPKMGKTRARRKSIGTDAWCRR
ncbi:MAG: hypothetical protein U5L98_01985 [Halomonas sp.]|uniref:hypothetical protein n=1 Tax=Halomonas sp. TaxID=1486246 RepID=UPI002ACDDDC9|nr:hypothetical protein [Halomonas sp.]MDZ7851436.1 hypothetical protein [Halomonas sp.]